MRFRTSWIILLFWLVFYVYFQVNGIYGGDAGDFVSAAYVQGIPHPPGFPFYIFVASLLTKIGIGTVAWRVGFLSSIPTAFACYFLFLFLKRYFRENTIPFLVSLIFGFTYPVWLFAITVEVYSFNLFLTSLTFYLLYRCSTEKNSSLYLFLLSFGLTLAHHQLIIFLIPGFLYFIYINRKKIKINNYIFLIKAVIIVSLGFLPYLYLLIIANNHPLISWSNPTNLQNLLNLMLKKQYGYVYSGASFSETAPGRFLSIPAYIDFLFNDFTTIGVILGILGFIYFFRTNRKFFYFLILLFIFSGPFLYFYAGFKIFDAFRVAIFEQFLSFSYFFIAVFIAGGIILTRSVILKIIKLISPSLTKRKYIYLLVNVLFLPYALSIFFINYPKLSILKNDFTGNKLGEDVLKTVEKDSILFLISDTILFDTQYIYFTQNITPGVKLFHFEKFLLGEYQEPIKKYYSELVYPKDLLAYELLHKFILENYTKFPIYTNMPFDHGMGENAKWVKLGILYRFFMKDSIPDNQEIIRRNDSLWLVYQNPLEGSLKFYENLFVTGVLYPYGIAHQEYGKFLLMEKEYNKALEHINKTYDLLDDDFESYYVENELYIKLNKCQDGLDFIDKNEDLNSNKTIYYLLKGRIYQDCFNDEEKAKEFYGLSEIERSKQDVTVDKL